MENQVNETIEILKIIVPAISSFLGVLAAGFVGFYASIKSVDKNHKYHIELEKRNRFSLKISSSIEGILSILVSNLKKESFKLSSLEKQQLLEYSLWCPKEIATAIENLTNGKDSAEKADEIINEIRKFTGIE